MFTEQLDSDTEFWTKSLSSTIGLGALWRFPYLLYRNKGAPFFIPFLIIMVFLGIPQYFLELSLGQYFQESVFYIYLKPGKKYTGVNYTIFLLCLIIGSYYIYIISFAILYIYFIFTGLIPWIDEQNDLQGMMEESNVFFKQRILNFSEDLNDRFLFNFPLLLAYTITVLAVYFLIRRRIGISSWIIFAKVALPFVVIFLLIGKIAFLPGFLLGFYHLTIPNVATMMHPNSWVAAAEQVLFQLSLGAGTLINQGAIRRKKSSIMKPCFVLPLLNALASSLNGILIYGFFGYLAGKFEMDIDALPVKGEGLVFYAYPMIFTMFGDYGKILLGLFFGVFVITGIDSQVRLQQFVNSCEDKHH